METLETLHRQAYVSWRAIVLLPDGWSEARSTAAIAARGPHLLGRLRLKTFRRDEQQDLLRWPDVREPCFLVLLTAGDRLSADALLEFATVTGGDGTADFVYSDGQCQDLTSDEAQSWRKPDWPADSRGQLWCVARELLEAAGTTLEELLAYGEYRAMLRLTEKARAIVHVPRVLCERDGPYIDAPEATQRLIAR